MADVARLGRLGRGAAGIAARRSVLPPTRFLLLTPGRAGSTLLMSLLDGTPEVRCDDEVLRTASGDATRLLARRAARATLGGVRAWGTSVHPEHLLRFAIADPVAWMGSLHDDGFELLTLVRRNPLAIALSAVIADQRGQWHDVGTGEPEKEQPAVTLDPMHVLRIALQAERSTEEVRRMVGDRSHLALVYEDDLLEADRHQATADRVFAFLGLTSAPVSSPLRRRTRPLREQVANLEAVRAVLAPTRFGPLLDLVD